MWLQSSTCSILEKKVHVRRDTINQTFNNLGNIKASYNIANANNIELVHLISFTN